LISVVTTVELLPFRSHLTALKLNTVWDSEIDVCVTVNRTSNLYELLIICFLFSCRWKLIKFRRRGKHFQKTSTGKEIT